MALDGRLDLHGMTRERAHQALTVFLHRAHERGARCVLVVTGKGTGREGGGVLRRDVPLWLGQGGVRRIVLSTAPAQARDGGDGALYVLLRRRRDSAQTLGRTSSS
ncbi:Smr domain-containing protein [Rhodospira trueperi]|uniref:Smr domain-containing protein n=2 Tax=Rhodospira trueperi TaxID=69960 RepID=A0A1G6W6T2_9PROT|nr:Smr domain-containing protein [Rhodospira trueperi]